MNQINSSRAAAPLASSVICVDTGIRPPRTRSVRVVHDTPRILRSLVENKDKLVPTLRDYISVRKRLAETSEAKTGEAKGSNDAPEHTTERPTASQDIQIDIQMDEPESSSVEDTRQKSPTISSILDAASSRELLTKVASLSDEMVRACNEKVNVARFAYDLVRMLLYVFRSHC